MGNLGYHEGADNLSAGTRNVHRALTSMIEELEAVDWYNQRAEVCDDEQLKAVLAHNRDEEIEHASMLLEWLRRQVPKFDEHLKTYLFTKGDLLEIEEQSDEGGNGHPNASRGGRGLGILKGD